MQTNAVSRSDLAVKMSGATYINDMASIRHGKRVQHTHSASRVTPRRLHKLAYRKYLAAGKSGLENRPPPSLASGFLARSKTSPDRQISNREGDQDSNAMEIYREPSLSHCRSPKQYTPPGRVQKSARKRALRSPRTGKMIDSKTCGHAILKTRIAQSCMSELKEAFTMRFDIEDLPSPVWREAEPQSPSGQNIIYKAPNLYGGDSKFAVSGYRPARLSGLPAQRDPNAEPALNEQELLAGALDPDDMDIDWFDESNASTQTIGTTGRSDALAGATTGTLTPPPTPMVFRHHNVVLPSRVDPATITPQPFGSKLRAEQLVSYNSARPISGSTMVSTNAADTTSQASQPAASVDRQSAVSGAAAVNAVRSDAPIRPLGNRGVPRPAGARPPTLIL